MPQPPVQPLKLILNRKEYPTTSSATTLSGATSRIRAGHRSDSKLKISTGQQTNNPRQGWIVSQNSRIGAGHPNTPRKSPGVLNDAASMELLMMNGFPKESS